MANHPGARKGSGGSPSPAVSMALVVYIILSLGIGGPARAGSAEGLAAYKRNDYATAMREYRPLADQGDPAAQVAVGWLYDNALGVPHDDAEAAKWYTGAAQQGYKIAQQYLGTMYAEGDGVPQSYTEAEKWFRRAAQQGDAGGQYGLGVMYRDGVVVARDLIQAYMWFSLSDIAGGNQSQQALDARSDVAERMSAEDIHQAEELVRSWKPTPERQPAIEVGDGKDDGNLQDKDQTVQQLRGLPALGNNRVVA